MSSSPSDIPPTDAREYAQWLDELIPVPEGARLRKVHPATIRREEKRRAAQGKRPHLIRTSANTVRIRRGDALLLNDNDD